MKTRIKSIEECTKLFKIEIPHEMVQEVTAEIYAQIKKAAKIPGFRPGSAPQDLLEKHHAEDAKSEVLKRLIPEGYKKAIDNHKVQPVSSPKILNVNFEPGKPLTFEAEVDTRPNIKLKAYKGIKVKKQRISVTQEEIAEALTRMRSMSAKYKDVERPVKKEDYAICDIEAFIDGKPITKKSNNMWVAAAKEESLLGMGEELIGLAKGETKEIETKLPEKYPDKKYAGKTAKFKVLVNGVKEKELPTLDDAFAKSVNIDSLDALKKEIETQLFTRKENTLAIDMKSQILDKLLKDHKFSVPSGIVKRQKEVLAKRLETELLQKGVQKEEVAEKVKELDSKLDEDAKAKVCIYFILDDISEKEKIEIDEKDISGRLEMIAAQTGQSLKKVKEYYENENLLGGLAEELKEVKVLEFLLKEAQTIE